MNKWKSIYDDEFGSEQAEFEMTLDVQIILKIQYLICGIGIRSGGKLCEYPLEVFTEGMKSRWKFQNKNSTERNLQQA